MLRCGCLGAFGVLGAGLYTLAAGQWGLHPPVHVQYPLPHSVPLRAEAKGLRFAQVHAVLRSPTPPTTSPLADRTHALSTIESAREALASVRSLDWSPKPLRSLEHVLAPRRIAPEFDAPNQARQAAYRARADLGTTLILAAQAHASPDGREAQDWLEEGQRLLSEAVQIEPTRHAPREFWRAAWCKVEGWIEATPQDGGGIDARGSARAQHARATQLDVAQVSRETPDRRARARLTVRGVRLPGRVPTAPFDDPVLGILDMWTHEEGPQVRLAYALGTILRVTGQRYLAWEAFERARELADRETLGANWAPTLERIRAAQDELAESLQTTTGRLRTRWKASSHEAPPADLERLDTVTVALDEGGTLLSLVAGFLLGLGVGAWWVRARASR